MYQLHRWSAFATALSLLLVPAGSAAGTIGERQQSLFLADGTTSVYPVELGVFVLSSDSVYVAGELIDRSGYSLDFFRHELVLWERPAVWTPIVLVFHSLEFSGQPEPGLRVVPAQVADTGTGSVVLARVDTAATAAGGLALSGSKTLTVTAGGGDAGIDQATHLVITGRVEAVQVEAELSDQNSPIPPEGTTRDIEDLDKLAITLRAKQWRGSFGDVDLGLPVGSFGTISRRSVGAELSGTAGPAEALVGYATPRGQFGRIELFGQDGVQGPYVLAQDGRSAQVVAGSEEVHLDGRRLTRGWDADYTLDYSTGELVFTSRHIIDRYSRIEASFQYLTDAFRREGVVGLVAYKPSGLDLGAAVLREGDDAAQNLTEDLTPEQLAYLAGIGSDTSLAWLDGATYVGSGNGDYVRENDHFRYAGRDSGDYSVRFTLLGDSLGDYRYDDTTFAYAYVGTGSGNYVARVRVALPERNDLAYGRAGYRLGGLSAAAEGMFLRHNLNLYAANATNEAGALNLQAGWQDSARALAYERRMRGAGFVLPGSEPSADFTYRWGGVREAELAASDEILGRARLFPFLDLSAEAGRLSRSQGTAVVRYAGSLRAGWAKTEATRVGDVFRAGIELGPRFLWFYPRLGWKTELGSVDGPGTWFAGTEARPAPDASVSAEYRRTNRSERDTISGERRAAARNDLISASGKWSKGDWLQLSANGARNEMSYVLAPEQNWTQLVGTVSAAATPRTGLRLQGDISQLHRQVQLRDEVFRYVGPGEGDYRRDSVTGGYYPDEDGDYERTTVATGRFASAREWSLSTSGEVSVFEPATLTGVYSQTRASDTGLLTDLGRYDVRLSVLALEPRLSPALGATGDFSLDRTLAATGKAAHRNEEYLEVYEDASPEVPGRLRLSYTRTTRLRNASVVEYDETGRRLELSPVVGRSLRLEVGFSVERRDITEPYAYPELGRFALTSWSMSLGRSTNLRSGMRITTSVAAVYRVASAGRLPYDVEVTDPLGWVPSAGLSIERTFNNLLSGSASYRFSDRPDRAAEHNVSAGLHARF